MGEIMNQVRTSIKEHKYIYLLLSLILLIGIIVGIIYYFKQSSSTINILNTEISNYKNILENIKTTNILFHLGIIIIITLLSFTIIGYPFILFYLFYEGMAVGFLVTSFIKVYSLGGFIYSLIFIVISKFIYLIIIIYLANNSFNLTKKVFGIITNKNKEAINNTLKLNFFRLIIAITITIINDLLIYYLGLKILKLFIFLL